MRARTDMALRAVLDDACRSTGAAGAALAVLEDGVIRTAEAGVANVATGEPVTATTRFPTGSICKAYTSMLVLELVAEGRLSLDDPVRRYLPDLRLAPGSGELADAITVRHLLANTCGLPGYHLPHVGSGDDALARFLATLEAVALLHVPGERFAYSNPGFVLAGLIVERLRGATWDTVLAERLLAPLGLLETGSRPDQLGGAPVAAGHQLRPDGILGAVPWAGPWAGAGRGNGPAGTSCFTTASDLARFAAVHLNAGWEAMREPQVELSGPHAEAWGLGWGLYGWDASVFGWEGIRLHCRAYLRILPEHGAAIALLANADTGRRVYRALLPGLLAERFGVTMAPERPATLPEGAVVDDPRRFSGDWRCAQRLRRVTPSEDGGDLLLDSEQLQAIGVTSGTRLLPTGEPGAFVQESPDVEFPMVCFDGDFAIFDLFGFRRQA